MVILHALQKLSSEGSHASIQTNPVLTLMDLSKTGRLVLQLVVRSLKRKGILWLGRPGVGKTMSADVIGFGFSRFYQADLPEAEVVAKIREFNDLDFVKDEPGKKDTPYNLDDCDINEFSMKTLKTYFDMQSREQTSRARYTAAKTVQGQLRQASDNKWDGAVEPCQTVNGEAHPLLLGYEGTSQKTFWDMTRPAFIKEAGQDDILAIQRRANIVVNGKFFVYVRPAGWEEIDGEAAVRVQRVPYEVPKSYLTEDAVKKLTRATESGWCPNPAEFLEDVRREQKYLHDVFRLKAGQPTPILEGNSRVVVPEPVGENEEPAEAAPAIAAPSPGVNAPAVAAEPALAIARPAPIPAVAGPAAGAIEEGPDADMDVFGHGFGLDEGVCEMEEEALEELADALREGHSSDVALGSIGGSGDASVKEEPKSPRTCKRRWQLAFPANDGAPLCIDLDDELDDKSD